MLLYNNYTMLANDFGELDSGFYSLEVETNSGATNFYNEIEIFE